MATTATTPTTQADAITAMIQATLTPIIAPLVGELAASRQANERQAERLEALARENGRLSSAMEATAAGSIALKVRESRHLAELDTLRAELAAARTVESPPDEPGGPQHVERPSRRPGRSRPPSSRRRTPRRGGSGGSPGWADADVQDVLMGDRRRTVLRVLARAEQHAAGWLRLLAYEAMAEGKVLLASSLEERAASVEHRAATRLLDEAVTEK